MPEPIYTPDNCKAAYQLNWLAYVQGMRPIYQFGFFVGT